MTNRPLTQNELFEITGYKKPSLQHKTLQAAGIFSIFKKPTNTVFTTWHHVLNPSSQQVKSSNTQINEPDFGALH